MLQQAESKISHMPNLHIQIGHVYNKVKKWSDAERSFTNALAIDINNAHAYHGLSLSLLRQYKYEEAADAALDAIGLLYHFPEAHYYLGEILFQMKDYERAAQAFEVSISMMPGYKKGHIWLIRIYEECLHQPERAERSRQFIRDKIKGTITVVSGLPRSGTSMMMQMLKAGGMEMLTDDIRQNDDNNPKGYMEYEDVKKLAKDRSWLSLAEGKTVKIISHLLTYLPDTYNYKIIFMQRDMIEVLTSQQKMLGRDTRNFPAGLADTFEKQLSKTGSWLTGQPNMEVIYVNYKDIIEQPEEQSENINAFLGQDLDINKMTEAIDRQLYRNKII
jgi:hypothetical protein